MHRQVITQDTYNRIIRYGPRPVWLLKLLARIWFRVEDQ